MIMNHDDWVGKGYNESIEENAYFSLFALSKITHAYSSMTNEEWGIWKQGISCEENRREKPKIKHFGSFWLRKW